MLTRPLLRKGLMREGMGRAMVMLALAALLAAASGVAQDAAEVPDVVARVGEDTITRAEFLEAIESTERAMRAHAQSQGQQLDGGALNPQMKAQILDNLVNEQILIELAEQAGVSVPEDELDERIAALKQGRTPEQWAEGLRSQGLTEEDLRERIGRRLLIQEYIESATPDVEVTDEELQEAYNELKESGALEKPQTADVSHILVRAQGDEAKWDEAKKKIDDARKRVTEGGEDFETVMEEVSEDPGGGVYPDTPQGAMVPEFDKAMFEIDLNTVSDPIRTQFGWHILKVTDRSEAGTATLEEIEDRLREQLEMQKRQEWVEAKLQSARTELKVEVLYNPLEGQGAQAPAGLLDSVI